MNPIKICLIYILSFLFYALPSHAVSTGKPNDAFSNYHRTEHINRLVQQVKHGDKEASSIAIQQLELQLSIWGKHDIKAATSFLLNRKLGKHQNSLLAHLYLSTANRTFQPQKVLDYGLSLNRTRKVIPRSVLLTLAWKYSPDKIPLALRSYKKPQIFSYEVFYFHRNFKFSKLAEIVRKSQLLKGPRDLVLPSNLVKCWVPHSPKRALEFVTLQRAEMPIIPTINTMADYTISYLPIVSDKKAIKFLILILKDKNIISPITLARAICRSDKRSNELLLRSISILSNQERDKVGSELILQSMLMDCSKDYPYSLKTSCHFIVTPKVRLDSISTALHVIKNVRLDRQRLVKNIKVHLKNLGHTQKEIETILVLF